MGRQFVLSQKEVAEMRREGFVSLGPLFTSEQIELITSIRSSKGRDLYRQSEALKKFETGRLFSAIAKGIVSRGQVRLAMDQKLPENYSSPGSVDYSFCFHGIAFALTISLCTPDLGEVVLYAPDAPIQPDERSRLLILYSFENAQYKHNENDPNTHELKNSGYVFGDHLKQAFHPLIVL
ncbi:MAG: hypothetical protein MRY21_02185 [Simkaniaceae bacterium]|nr:hypothetical protein [Simkaniaceae bacterium]